MSTSPARKPPVGPQDVHNGDRPQRYHNECAPFRRRSRKQVSARGQKLSPTHGQRAERQAVEVKDHPVGEQSVCDVRDVLDV